MVIVVNLSYLLVFGYVTGLKLSDRYQNDEFGSGFFEKDLLSLL